MEICQNRLIRISLKYGAFIVWLIYNMPHIRAQEASYKSLDSLVNVLGKSTADTQKVKLYYNIAFEYQSKSTEKAQQYTEEGLLLARKLKWKSGILDLMMLKGNILSDIGRSEEAIQIYLEILSQVDRKKDVTRYAKVNNDLGTSYMNLSDFVRASEYYYQALKLAEKVKDTLTIGVALSNIAGVFYHQEHYENALKYQQRALQLFEAVKDRNHIARVTTSIGNAYIAQGDIEQAKQYYFKAIKIYEAIDNRTGVANLYSKIAILYEPDFEKIIAYQLKSQAIWDSLNPSNYYSVVNLGNLGLSYLFLKRSREGQAFSGIQAGKALLDKSEFYIRKGLEINKINKNASNEAILLELMAELLEEKGEFKEALKYQKSYMTLKDSLYSQSVKNKIASLERQREIELKDQELILKDLRFRQFLLYGILTVLVLLGAIIYLIYRQRVRDLKLRNELQEKEFLRQQEALILERKVAETELMVIRSQMNPHFIFNVLNSIESYILDQDARMASKLIQKFAVLSRLVLENSTQSMVIAEKDWKALQLYVELEAIRFDYLFAYSFQVIPPLDLSTIMLPPMLIQPLAENAIHHGLRNISGYKGALSVRIKQQKHFLEITVEDNGKGIYHTRSESNRKPYKEKSMGIEGIRARLELLNQSQPGVHASLEITEIIPYGTRAILNIPVASVANDAS